MNNEKILIYKEEYDKLIKEHQLLAILRSYDIESWEYWDKAVSILTEEGMKNGNN